MERRDFLRACAAGCAIAGMPARGAQPLSARHYERVLLVRNDGEPLRAASLVAERNYLFHYPFAATPCFLLRLSRPAGKRQSLETADRRPYSWPGGVGPDDAIVAYSAICAHKLAYPTREINFISYRPEPTIHGKTERVIHCCSEHSQYDPARGARVVAGPAPQPLAAILLEHDQTSDHLYAVGTLGGELFNDFFQKYAFKLSMEYGEGRAARNVGPHSTVHELADYCRQQVRC